MKTEFPVHGFSFIALWMICLLSFFIPLIRSVTSIVFIFVAPAIPVEAGFIGALAVSATVLATPLYLPLGYLIHRSGIGVTAGEVSPH